MKTIATTPQSTRLIAAPAVAGLILLANASAQMSLVNENWQSPLLTNNTQFTTSFTGWTFNGGAYANREDAAGDVPGDATITYPNQIVQLNGDATYGEINIAHNWAATDTYYLRIEASPAEWNGHVQRYIRPELRQQDGTLLWAAPQDSTTAVPLYGSYMGALTDYPSELTFFFKIDANTFTAGAAGQPLRLRLDGSGQRALYINNVSLVLGPLPADTTPPTPDPLTWDIVPTVSNFRTISMRIGSARDGGDLYGVEYYFENLTDSTNSGWQSSRQWAQTGLDYNTTYTYRVKARDKSPNANESTTWSVEQSATTPVQDLTPPTPDPLTWATPPTVADYRSITMTADAASDPNGVQYYFENVTNSTNSGWLDSRSWTQKDLNPATLYTYRVKARDKTLTNNESTTWSTEQSATTPTEPAGTLLVTRFEDPLIPSGTAISAGLIGNWANYGGKVWKYPTDGMRTDTDLAVPGDNRVIQFEYTDQWIEYNLPHNWYSADTFTLTINASPQAWNGESQRYVRPSLRQQDGTVLWAPGENMSGPEKTAVPLYSTLVGSSWQDDPNLTFSYTIPASAFSAGTAGQPIRLRIASSGVVRGLFIDNVNLSVSTAPAKIVAFGIPGSSGVIDQSLKTIDLTVPYTPYGASGLGSLAPDFLLSSGTCNQASGFPPSPTFAVQNPATYTVTDDLGDADPLNDVVNTYTVTVTVTPASTENVMSKVYFPGAGYAWSTSATDFLMVVPAAADVTALAPTFSVSQFATCSPVSGTARDFSTPQTYTVTAEDGFTQDYMVTVQKITATGTGAYQQKVLASGPVSYWPLNETEGTTAFDLASGLNPITYGGTYTLNQTGLRADGNPSVLFTTADSANNTRAPFNNSLNPLQFTVECWVKPTNTTVQYLVSLQDRTAGGRIGYAIWKNNGSAGFGIMAGIGTTSNGVAVNGATVAAVGNSYHVVGTYDGTTLKLYVNGNLEGSAPMVYVPATANHPGFTIGSRNGVNPAPSYIQDVALYTRALTQAEIQNHYQSTAGGDFASWQSANGATGQTLAQDHDNDGVPNGIEWFLKGSSNSTGFTALPGVVKDPGTGALSVTWTKDAGYTGAYPADFVVETSETLSGTWTAEASPGTVTITGNEVKYTFPSPLGSKNFARLKVTGP